MADARPIYVARLDTPRPALVLTRLHMLDVLRYVTVAPITSTVRGLPTEVQLGARNGLDHECVVSCDNITTIASSELGTSPIGYLLVHQELQLAAAIAAAFDLEPATLGVR